MKYINVRQLTRNLKEATAELPVRVTQKGIPIFDIVPVGGEKNFEKKIPEKIDVEKPLVHKQSEPSHICEWDKTFKCTSPATIKKGSKWYCTPHSIQV